MLSRLTLLIAVLCLPVLTTARAQDEVDIERLSAATQAFHEITVFATNGNSDGDYTVDFTYGTTEAIASTMDAQAGAAVFDPNAGAFGSAYNIAHAGWGRNRNTEGICYRDLYVYSKPTHPGVQAWCDMDHSADAEAHWTIPEGETGDTWIQAEIELVGIAGWAHGSPDGQIKTEIGCIGAVEVADSYIGYIMWPDGTIDVNGTLMDLDGPHQINATFPGPVVTFTVRQYIDPGTEFVTYTSHGSLDFNFDLYTEVYQGYPAQGVFGTTMARSKHLEAYVGDPPD
jgi:hypothetical protein